MRQKALLLDRDGVINVDHGYIGTIDRFVFRDGIFDFLRAAQNQGYRLVVVTNQAGVARGYYTEADFQTLTKHMLAELGKQGIAIDLMLAAFEHEEGEHHDYRRASYWRKPNPGMMLEAAVRLNLDLARSAMIGDRGSDMEAALAAPVGTCLWLTDATNAAMDGVTVVRGFDDCRKILGL